MPTVNSNIAAKYALNNLNKTDRDLTTAMERLSSGKRINHAGDDAAGAAISDRMTSQIKGLEQSARNAADVISMAQVTEGALDETSSILQRVRMLAIQSATDSYNAEERSYLNTEVQQLLAEHDRVTRDTTFNEIAVLDGTFADRRFQIGVHEREFATLSISSMRLDALGAFKVTSDTTDGEYGTANTSGTNSASTANNLALNALATDTVSNANLVQAEDITIHGILGSKTLTTTAGSTIRDVATLVNNAFETTGVNALASTQLKIEAKAFGSENTGQNSVAFTIQGKNATATAVSGNITFGATTGTSNLSALRDAVNNYTTTTGVTATLSADSTSIILVQNEGYDIKLGDVDFAGDTASSGPNKVLVVTSLDNDEATAGSSIMLADKAAVTTDADDVVASASGTASNAMTLNTSGKASTASATSIAASQSGTGFSAGSTVALVSGATSLTLNSRITLTSGGNDAARTATITGKDLYGNTLIEDVTMGNAAAVTSTKVFKSVDSISVSGALAGTITAGIEQAVNAKSSLVTITSTTGDESAVLFSVVGYDMDGNAQTEVIKGPTAGNTASGRLVFSSIFSVTPASNTSAAVTVGLKGADSAIISGQLEFYSSNSFTVLGEEEKSLFESSPGAASLDKLETVDVKTRESSINALRIIDRSLDRIHKERAKLGALMSRMEKAIDNLTNVAVNTEASRGRIRDANFAKESATLTKAQILQQSALAMIAQAGRIQQNVLTLLQN
ncbi:MAG: flagellin [SAR116 cluster bacterium]|nr:flagellin [SAR116 cluster bacterium]RPH09252.1 MAG: flagellin [Alphaproteobacteria bacterium TMED54]